MGLWPRSTRPVVSALAAHCKEGNLRSLRAPICLRVQSPPYRRRRAAARRGGCVAYSQGSASVSRWARACSRDGSRAAFDAPAAAVPPAAAS